MQRRGAWLAAAVAGCLGIGGFWALTRDNGGDMRPELGPPTAARRVVVAPPPTDERPASPPRARAARGGTGAGRAQAPPPGELPASLRETDVDGALVVDEHGRFLVNPETRLFFDYFLSATGEESPAALRARVVAAIAARLPAAAAADAVALFDRYLAYREAARRLEVRGDGAPDVAERFAQIWALRRRTLGAADADALFGPEEARDRVEVERVRILADGALSATEREQRLAAVDAALPEAARAARAAAMQPQRLRQEETALRAAAGSDEEIQALRVQEVGPEAASRLAALDAQRARWRERVDEYRRARATIDRDTTLTPEERQRAGEALLAARFTATERLRVTALERVLAPADAPPVLSGLTTDGILSSPIDPDDIDDKDVR